MQGQERRDELRFIMRVPLRLHASKQAALREEAVSSLNISAHGVYFATDQKVAEGLMVELHLRMPKEIVGDAVEERSFTGRVAHVESLPEKREVRCRRAVFVLRAATSRIQVSGYSSQPLRRSGATIFWAASELSTFRFLRSHSNLCPARRARLPN